MRSTHAGISLRKANYFRDCGHCSSGFIVNLRGLTHRPICPVNVTLTQVKYQSIQPSLFGVATVEARYNYKIGPTAAGRLKNLKVDIGDNVQAEQLLGEMDPVDLEDRLLAQRAIIQKNYRSATRHSNPSKFCAATSQSLSTTS